MRKLRYNPSMSAQDFADEHIYQGDGEEILAAGWIGHSDKIWFVQRANVDECHYWFGTFDADYQDDKHPQHSDEMVWLDGYETICELGAYEFCNFDPQQEPFELERFDGEEWLEDFYGEPLDGYDIDGIIDEITEIDVRTGNRYVREYLKDDDVAIYYIITGHANA